jgi:hypothetical protein
VPRYSSKTGQLLEYQVGPFDSTHLYVQWGGKLPGGEEWSCGFRMWKASGSNAADATAVLPSVSAAVAAYHIRQGTNISARAKLSFVKVNAIAVDGSYQAQTTTQALFADTPGGGLQSAPPNQIAHVVSLTTGFSRGPAHRGRFFNPLPSFTVDATGVIAEADATAVAVSAGLLLAAVNQGGGEQMVVMSRKAGAPGHRAVTGIEVGRVLDTQRRRRRSLVEGYMSD